MKRYGFRPPHPLFRIMNSSETIRNDAEAAVCAAIRIRAREQFNANELAILKYADQLLGDRIGKYVASLACGKCGSTYRSAYKYCRACNLMPFTEISILDEFLGIFDGFMHRLVAGDTRIDEMLAAPLEKPYTVPESWARLYNIAELKTVGGCVSVERIVNNEAQLFFARIANLEATTITDFPARKDPSVNIWAILAQRYRDMDTAAMRI